MNPLSTSTTGRADPVVTLGLPGPDTSIHDLTNGLWLEWATLFVTGLAQAQQLQAQALIGWQATMMGIGKEAWDEWQCRFAGGVPIDG